MFEVGDGISSELELFDEEFDDGTNELFTSQELYEEDEGPYFDEYEDKYVDC